MTEIKRVKEILLFFYGCFFGSKISFKALRPCPGLKRKARSTETLKCLKRQSDQRKLLPVCSIFSFGARTWREKPDKARKTKIIRFGIPKLLKETGQKTRQKLQIS